MRPLGATAARTTEREDRSGDAVSFEQLYRQWVPAVSRWVLALGTPHSDHEDVVQDIFAVVCRRFTDFVGSNVSGWLFQITRRKVRDYHRLSWVQRVSAADPVIAFTIALQPGRGPLDELETKRRSELLSRRLARLPDKQRLAFTLFELEGFSGVEIAHRQQVPLNTVWLRLYKARRKLRRKHH